MTSGHLDLTSDDARVAELAGGIAALPLLTTKLYRPPDTPHLEKRSRLIQRLDRSRQRPLTLILAPAGYGKTMLASVWLESCDCASALLSLDEGGQRPAHLCALPVGRS